MKKEYLNMNIIGSDETGVGDYFTPLVIAACYVSAENAIKLENLGITDSKKMTDSKILLLAKEVKKLTTYSIKHIGQEKYNAMSNYWNANELKMLFHMLAITELETKVSADLIIVDKFSTDKSIEKYKHKVINSFFKVPDFKTKVKYVEKGELEHVAVASASVLARAKLLELMEKQNRIWKEHFPLGASKIVEEFGKKFVKKHGVNSLNKVSKMNFKTTDKILGNNI